MSNIGFEIYLKKSGIKLVRAKVGDRYVVEEMVKLGCNLGGEQSGHIIFLDHNTTGDGPITALQVLSIMSRREKTLSELASYIPIYPQILVNVLVKKSRDLKDFPSIASTIRRAEKKLENGRILVRPSGTEPKIRVMVEGDNMDDITTIAEDIADVIRKHMS